MSLARGGVVRCPSPGGGAPRSLSAGGTRRSLRSGEQRAVARGRRGAHRRPQAALDSPPGLTQQGFSPLVCSPHRTSAVLPRRSSPRGSLCVLARLLLQRPLGEQGSGSAATQPPERRISRWEVSLRGQHVRVADSCSGGDPQGFAGGTSRTRPPTGYPSPPCRRASPGGPRDSAPLPHKAEPARPWQAKRVHHFNQCGWSVWLLPTR